jgi:hypothetical protein
MQPYIVVATVPSFYQGHARERDERSNWCYDMCNLVYRSSEEWSLKLNDILSNPLSNMLGWHSQLTCHGHGLHAARLLQEPT